MPATSNTNEFGEALATHASRYGVELRARNIEQLCGYYKLLSAWNARLHLVAPCTPMEFATRHVLESLLALKHLPQGARVADVGSGGGLPIIPCLIMRPDLEAILIESSAKKSIFLREALRGIETEHPARIINERFEKLTAPDVDFITCRALERFTEKLKEIVDWSMPETSLLFFGGDAIREELERAARSFTVERIPESERRYLFIVQRR